MAKLSTSVGRSCPLYRRLSRRIESRPRKVTEMSAWRRSPVSTASTTRRTNAAGSGRRRPLTDTSLPLGGLEFRRDTAAGTGIPDALMVGARHHPGELALDPVDVAQGERRVLELAGGELLLDQQVDRLPHLVGRGIGEHADGGLGRIGQHGDGGLRPL